MANDLRFALRQLIKDPGFTLVAVLILGLGIGANTALFSVINALLFRPISVDAPEQLVRLHSKDVNPDGGFRGFSYPNFLDIRSQNDVFQEVTAFTMSMVGITEGETTRRVFATSVAANYFGTFGVRMAQGREFLPEEERPDAALPVAIVSHSYAKTHGGADEILGRSIRLNGRQFEVVGIAPAGFSGFSALLSSEVYVPLGAYQWFANDFMNQKGRTLRDRANHCLMVVGRLRSELTPAQAQSRLEPLAGQLRDAYPEENKDQTLVAARPSRLSINVAPSNDKQMVGGTALLLPMSGVVLLIAALNLANMLLARGTARRKEFAIRSALGGGRFQIVRQLVCEAFLLSLAGGAVALVLAAWVSRLLGTTFATKVPFATLIVDSGPDVRVLAFTFLFCLLATVVATLMPAMRLSKVDIMRDLKEHGTEGRRDSGSRSLLAPRNVLVTSQIALSLVLLAIATLFYRGATRAAHANPGFRFEQGVLAELDAGLAGYDQTRSAQVYSAVLERLRALPGVESASLATSVPFGLFSDNRSIARPGTKQAQQEGQKLAEADQPVYANYTVVTDDYFKSLGARMVRGREFTRLETESTNAAPVAIINEAAANRIWPGEDPIGRQLEILDGGKTAPVVVEIVGVASGFKAAIGDQEPSPYLYLPLAQAFQSMLNLHVRLTNADVDAEEAMVTVVRTALRQVDADLPLLSINTLRDFHNKSFVLWIFNTGARLLFIFALLALVLAAFGVYGVKAFVVARRNREIGIRMALGATEGQVVWMILRSGLGLTVAGLALGTVLALGMGQLMRSILFGVSATDPLSFGMALLVLAAVAMIASYVPASRAARVDPVRALRAE